MRTQSVPFVLVLLALALPAPARAGGYDTPILYSARHMGMGGTAISFVNDPSALFHNPAGLGHTKFLSVTADFSPILGKITSTPATIRVLRPGGDKPETVTNVTSETVFAPFFMAAASVRVTDWLTLGLGAYPVASAGAEYHYDQYSYATQQNEPVEDRTRIAFIEVAPGFAIDLPWNLRLGGTYRVTILQFARYQGPPSGENPKLDMDMLGTSFAGFKLGLQWQPIEWLQAGIVYRHRTDTTVEADEAHAFDDFTDVSMEFTLPSKLGVGVRADVPLIGLGVSVDAEYGFNSQNDVSALKGTNPAGEVAAVPNQFRWEDSVTLRGGLEYTMLGMVKLRGGYIYDGKVSSEKYPSAFGTPPAPSHTFTAGVGLDLKTMEFNIAAAYRSVMGTVAVSEEDIDMGTESCPFCSNPGSYDLTMLGLYADASLYF